MIKVIVFDMDGTLIHSDELVMMIYKRLTTEYPTMIPFESLDRNHVLALSYPEVIEKLYGNRDEVYFQKIKMLHQELKHHYLKSYQGVNDVLKTLTMHGYKLGLFTSEMHAFAIDELNILGLHDYFDHFIAFDDVKNPKPHPEGLFEMMHFFNCKPHEMVMVGDQLSDAYAAKDAGVYSILMDHEKSRPKHFLSMYHHVAYDTNTLLDIILNREKMFIEMPKGRDLKIIQFTDLHLMNDEKDVKTYRLIKRMVESEKPDFIAITGDQTMSKHAVKLYQDLGLFMDQFRTPYTFVFGNHDLDGGHTYQMLIDAIKQSSYLCFDQGPVHLGYSNFNIMLILNHELVGRLTFMDSHIDDYFMIDGKKTWGYGVFSKEQIDWYKLSHHHPLPHLVFFHIPLVEMKETTPDDEIHQGDYQENPSVQGINTGFFETSKESKHVKGMFFGHDHYNDFTYKKDGIIMAYGRVSGYYEYGAPGFPKGARIIFFNSKGELKTHVMKYPTSGL